MLKEFSLVFPGTQDPIVSAFSLIGSMEELLNSLSSGNIPNASYTLEDLTEFCVSLVKGQRNETKLLKPGSWCVFENYDGMDSEARVDFAFFPTYYAIAILTLFPRRFPSQARKIRGLKDALRRGYKFATYRRLMGHGFEGQMQRDRALEILRKGQVDRALSENPDLSPELFEILFGQWDLLIKGDCFRYYIGQRDCPVHLCGFFVVKPKAETEIANLVRKVSESSRCSCIIGNKSKESLGARKEGSPIFAFNDQARAEYNTILGKFKDNSGGVMTKEEGRYLSISLRGMVNNANHDVIIYIRSDSGTDLVRIAEWLSGGFKYFSEGSIRTAILAVPVTGALTKETTLYLLPEDSFDCPAYSVEVFLSKEVRTKFERETVAALGSLVSGF